MPKNAKSSEELLEEISMKLDMIIAVLVISGKEPEKQIKILAGLGFSISQTSAITGLTIDVVKKTRSKLKKSWIGFISLIFQFVLLIPKFF